jgi:tetratricopeptide (TPR) repeat protein
MLKDLPKDAFVFGGTDPGRFVPTYMILGESFVDPEDRRDPDFDRRDLVIVTQNALADAFYQKYIHDHYAPGRPKAEGWFEKWLGRDRQYPPDSTIMPSEQELMEIVRNVSMNLPPGANPQDPNVGILYHAAIAQWIFEKNKDKREFFIEESFPMEWTYPYAVPNGLSYRLNKEPLETLPPETVAEDFRYWNDYVERLLADKNFHEDFDAKRSFSKLRNSTGNIYRARRMWAEAERAYRQALQLHPNNMESLVALSDILRTQKRWDEMAEVWDRAVEGDPHNRAVGKARERVTRLREADREIAALQGELAANPQNPEVVSNLLRLYMETGQPDLAQAQLEQSAAAFGDNPDFLKFAVDFCNSNGQWQAGLGPARKLAAVATNDPGVLLALARFQFANRDLNGFLETARQAVSLGGAQARAALANDPMYGMVRGTPEFGQLIGQ